MSVNWLIEEFNRDNSFLEIKDEAIKQGHTVNVVESIPFFYDSHWKLFPKGDCVIFLGSISCAKQLQREFKNHNWIPGVWCSWENYKCTAYYAYWGDFVLNSDYTLLPFAEFKRKLEKLFSKDKTLFIRPDRGDKPFNGGIYTEKEISKELEYADSLNPEDIILISSPKHIEREWRVICSEKKVITGSRYKTHGVVDYRRELPKEVEDFSNTIINSSFWEPDPIYVLDICCTGNKYFLLEIGSFSVAGLYHCEFDKIVETASELARKEHNIQ